MIYFSSLTGPKAALSSWTMNHPPVLLLVLVAACEFSGGGVALDSPDGGGSADAADEPTDGSSTEPGVDATDELIGEAGQPVQLGTAGDYAILAKAAISGTTATVTGNIGVSPAAATLITGFSLSLESPNVYSTSAQVTGWIYAADYPVPTPANLTLAVSELELACMEAAAREPDPGFLELNGGNLGGMILAPGVYRWSSGVSIPTDLTLHGNASSVWIFQIAQDLIMSSDTNIVLTGGARPGNVFWQVTGGPTTIGTMAHFEGILLTQTAVTVQAGATVTGRLLSQTSITIDGSTVLAP